MGLATSQLRLIYLTLFKSDLEYRIQLITQTKMGLANSVNDLLSIGTDLDQDSPELKMLEQRRHKLELVEKKLDAALERYKTQLSACETEVQSAQKFVDSNIKQSFTYGGNGH